MSVLPLKETLKEVIVQASSTSFDIALFTISSLLTEARYAEEMNNAPRAEQYYALAERRALHSGFLELVHLAWIDRDPVPSRR